MKEISLSVTYYELDAESELPDPFQQLLKSAKEAINDSYAPYSNFYVGAAALLENGAIIKGSNQENGSSPVGICAEGVTLSAASSFYPNVPVVAMAISARAKNSELSNPVAPCGLCRQVIQEYDDRFKRNIQLILQGSSGKIIWIDDAKKLLPLSFGRDLLRTND